MHKISIFFQIVFKLLLIFLIIFIWVRYFVSSLPLALVITISLTAIVDIVTRLISKKRSSIKSMKAAEIEEAENIFLTLSLDPHALDFFLSLAQKKHSAEKKKDFVLITHENCESVMLVPLLSHRVLCNDDIARLFCQAKKIKASKVVVVCYAYEKNLISFAKNFDVEFCILDRFESYQKLYKPYECKPEIKMSYKKEKGLAFKDLVRFSFNPSRAKGYFFSSIILLLSTLFVRATIYYTIVSSLLVAMSLASLYNPFGRNTSSGEIL